MGLTVPTNIRPTAGIVGEVRYNVDTDEMQTYDGTSWRTIGEPAKKIEWEKWRAWHPVRVNGHWTWGKIVYRHHVSSPGGGFYKYGTIFDVLKGAQ